LTSGEYQALDLWLSLKTEKRAEELDDLWLVVQGQVGEQLGGLVREVELKMRERARRQEERAKRQEALDRMRRQEVLSEYEVGEDSDAEENSDSSGQHDHDVTEQEGDQQQNQENQQHLGQKFNKINSRRKISDPRTQLISAQNSQSAEEGAQTNSSHLIDSKTPAKQGAFLKINVLRGSNQSQNEREISSSEAHENFRSHRRRRNENNVVDEMASSNRINSSVNDISQISKEHSDSTEFDDPDLVCPVCMAKFVDHGPELDPDTNSEKPKPLEKPKSQSSKSNPDGVHGPASRTHGRNENTESSTNSALARLATPGEIQNDETLPLKALTSHANLHNPVEYPPTIPWPLQRTECAKCGKHVCLGCFQKCLFGGFCPSLRGKCALCKQ